MKVTAEKVQHLLNGYCEEPRYLLLLLLKEEEKKPVNQKAIQAIEDELLLYDLLFDAVMALNSREKCFIIVNYFSGQKLTLREVSEHFECNVSTLVRWHRTALKTITKIMNEKLDGKDGEKDETD